MAIPRDGFEIRRSCVLFNRRAVFWPHVHLRIDAASLCQLLNQSCTGCNIGAILSRLNLTVASESISSMLDRQMLDTDRLPFRAFQGFHCCVQHCKGQPTLVNMHLPASPCLSDDQTRRTRTCRNGQESLLLQAVLCWPSSSSHCS